MTDLAPRLLRAAFARYMTGVTVVNSRDARGEPVGFTANSFTSVSLDPPLLLVCPGRHLSSYAVFRTAPFSASAFRPSSNLREAASPGPEPSPVHARWNELPEQQLAPRHRRVHRSAHCARLEMAPIVPAGRTPPPEWVRGNPVCQPLSLRAACKSDNNLITNPWRRTDGDNQCAAA